MGFFKRQDNKIRFTCRPEDSGVIAEPFPSKRHMPAWFKKLPATDKDMQSLHDTGLTVKRCLPFVDAMTTGWIIPLCAAVRMEISENGTKVDCAWDFDRPLVSNHGAHQVRGNPHEPAPPCKFLNYWTIGTPFGWSCLFINPLNRPNGLFETVAGIVDTDTYRSEIHFPFFATGKDGLYTLEKGTPLVQVIPFRRDAAAIEAVIGPESTREAGIREAILRKTKAAEGWYREHARERRN